LDGELVTNMQITTATKISSGAFAYCWTLVGVELSNTVTNIQENAFYSCTNLKYIVIPNSVLNIGSSAFEYCNKFQIYYEAAEVPSYGWVDWRE
jgi:hypothetical protein